LATLEKYFIQVSVIEHKDGSKEAVATSELLVKDTKSKFVCCWIENTCTKNVAGYCTHEKYCNQKGKVTSSSFEDKEQVVEDA
jgi:hypothetical protein